MKSVGSLDSEWGDNEHGNKKYLPIPFYKLLTILLFKHCLMQKHTPNTLIVAKVKGPAMSSSHAMSKAL